MKMLACPPLKYLIFINSKQILVMVIFLGVRPEVEKRSEQANCTIILLQEDYWLSGFSRVRILLVSGSHMIDDISNYLYCS